MDKTDNTFYSHIRLEIILRHKKEMLKELECYADISGIEHFDNYLKFYNAFDELIQKEAKFLTENS